MRFESIQMEIKSHKVIVHDIMDLRFRHRDLCIKVK